MPLILKIAGSQSYKGQQEIALCDESGNRLPYAELAISQADATGVVTVTATFRVDGKKVSIVPAWVGK